MSFYYDPKCKTKFKINDKILYIGPDLKVVSYPKTHLAKLIGVSGVVIEVFNISYLSDKVIYRIELNDPNNTTAIVSEKEITFDHKISRLLYV